MTCAVDAATLDAARDAARAEGLTLSAWLRRLVEAEVGDG